jgi:uncharacterized protein YlxW (UPF0749 family)
VPEHPHRARRRVARGTVSVALVLALAGLLFAANARFARGQEERHPQNLADLAARESDRVAELTTQVDGLRDDVERLTSRLNAAQGEELTPIEQSQVTSGVVPVTGPGLTVRLTDAPADGPHHDDVSADDLVVHQQDLQAVINALWAGGAEAMALQDQRVVSTTAFRCVGNVLSLHGRVYSPPYVVRAIGDPQRLRAALDASPAIQIYLEYVDAVGLGWNVQTESQLQLPAAEGPTELEFAQVPDGTEVLPGVVVGEGGA